MRHKFPAGRLTAGTPSARTNIWIAVLALVIFTVAPQPAAAQSFLQTIFGFLGPQKPAPKPIPRAPAPRQVNPFQTQPHHQVYVPRPRGRLRTVCVRLCDGYYFPISNTSSRRDFYRDAQACQSRCQANSRLYYMSAANPSIKHARDRRGFAYKDLKTAFLYRKRLSKSCTCKPEPWSIAERMRHKNYELAQPQMVASVVEPSLVEPSTIDGDTTAVPAPFQPTAQGHQPLPIAPQIAVPRVPAPRFVARRNPSPRRAPPQTRVSKRPIKKPSMGLGAVFAGGLPKVKYRHRWSGSSD